MKDFYQLFIKELKDLFRAEHQIAMAWPKMAKAAKSPKLKEVFHWHWKETQEQIKRFEMIATELHEDFHGPATDTMHSLIKDANRVIKSGFSHIVKDAALIACAQRIKHFEIASYGVLKTFARHLKLNRIEEWLNESSKEEGRFDKKLTEIAEGTLFSTGINVKASKRKIA